MDIKLFIYLEEDSNKQLAWVKVIGNQVETGKNNLDEIAQRSTNSIVFCILPAETTVLHQIKLPKMNKQSLSRAIPFALEDLYITEMANLHFAFNNQDKSGSVAVAIIANKIMDYWLSRLRDVKIYPHVLTTEIFCLPVIENGWQLILRNKLIVARTNVFEGFVIDRDNIQEEVLQQRLSESQIKPSKISLWNYTHSSLNNKLITEEKFYSSNKLIEQCKKLFDYEFINLLQGSYQLKHKLTSNKKLWKVTFCLAAGWIGITFFSLFISLIYLHHKNNKLLLSINKIYKSNFPSATAVVTPKQRMSSKLAQLTQQAQYNKVLVWLGHIAKSMTVNKAIAIQQIQYHDNLLNLNVKAPNVESIDQFSLHLKQQGLRVKQQNVNVAQNFTNALLVIAEENIT